MRGGAPPPQGAAPNMGPAQAAQPPGAAQPGAMPGMPGMNPGAPGAAPDMSQLLNNPQMLDMITGMLEGDPENNPFIGMIKQQMPSANPNTIKKGLKCLIYVVKFLSLLKRIWAY